MLRPARPHFQRGAAVIAFMGVIGGLRCGGGQSGDPGVGGTNPGVGVEPDPTVSPPLGGVCTYVIWEPDDTEPKAYGCEEVRQSEQDASTVLLMPEREWDCQCAGVSKKVKAQGCADAILDACGVDPTGPGHCTYELGTCFPDAEGEHWLCRCGYDSANPDTELAGVEAKTCEGALAACGINCSNEFGSCKSDLDSPDSRVCSCAPPPTSFQSIAADSYQNSNAIGRGEVIYENLTCERALETACGLACQQPELGGCRHDGANAFDCECKNDSTRHVVFESLEQRGRLPDCDGALRFACGTLWPEGECFSSAGTAFGRCQAKSMSTDFDAAVSESSFACTCSDDTALEEARESTVQAESCEQALRGFCPEAIRVPSDEGGTLGLGRLCTTDDECTGGKCYIPGNGQDPICSKTCIDDLDCPAIARCVSVGNQNVCMVRCNEDLNCVNLNDAVYNPLYCSDQFDAGDPVCVQSSEP